MRTFLLLVLLVAAGGLSAGQVLGRNYDVVEVAPGVFSVIWREVIAGPVAIGNSTFVVGDDSVIVVDATTLPRTARAVIAEIRARTQKPVRYLVVTHWHEDHIAGAEAFRDAWPGLEIVAHPDTKRDFVEKDIPLLRADVAKQARNIAALEAKRERSEREEKVLGMMRSLHAEMSALRFDLPTMLVTDSLTLSSGGRDVVVRYLGIGNTRGDLIVLLPEERVAITGDLAILPMQFALESDVGPWIETLSRVATLDAVAWVPGHGPVQHDSGYVLRVRSVLQQIRSRVAAGVWDGVPLETLLATIDVAEYRKESGGETGMGREWFDEYFLKPAIEGSYRELIHLLHD